MDGTLATAGFMRRCDCGDNAPWEIDGVPLCGGHVALRQRRSDDPWIAGLQVWLAREHSTGGPSAFDCRGDLVCIEDQPVAVVISRKVSARRYRDGSSEGSRTSGPGYAHETHSLIMRDILGNRWKGRATVNQLHRVLMRSCV